MPVRPDPALNTEHRLNPKVGDYWHEMFVPIMVVVGTRDDQVIICRKTKDAGARHWTWDLSQLDTIPRDEFAKIPLYSSPSMGDKTHCDVVPEAHKWARDAAVAAMFGEGT